MTINYDAFPELAATILDWWETGAIAVTIAGLFINFFFTMHKGKRYRIAFVLLLVTLITLLYVDAITPATKHVQADDMIRPIMYSSWAYTVWTRAWIYLDYFVQLKGQYEATIEQVLSAENTVVPWKEVAQFGAEMERWQNWVTRTIATVFAIGLLYSNVDRIEALQIVSIQSSRAAVLKERETKTETARIKRQQDSLLLTYIVNERKRMELLLAKIDGNKAFSVTNRAILLQDRASKLKMLESLKSLEQSVNSRLLLVPSIQPQSPNWDKSLSPDKVKDAPRFDRRGKPLSYEAPDSIPASEQKGLAKMYEQ